MSTLFHRNLVEIRGHRTLEDQASRLFRSRSARQNDRGGRSRYGSCTIIYLSTAQLLSRLVSSKHLLSSYRPSAISAGHRWSLPSRKKKMGKAVAHVDAALLCLKHRDPWSPTGGRRRQSSPKLRPWDSICKRGGDSLTTEPLHFRKSCLQWLSKTHIFTQKVRSHLPMLGQISRAKSSSLMCVSQVNSPRWPTVLHTSLRYWQLMFR